MKKSSRELKYVWLCLIMITISGCGDKEGKGLGLDPAEGGGVPHELAGTYKVIEVLLPSGYPISDDPKKDTVITIAHDGSFSAAPGKGSALYDPVMVHYKSLKADPSTLDGNGYIYQITGVRIDGSSAGAFTSHARYVKKGKNIHRVPQSLNSRVADVSGKRATEEVFIGQ